MPRSEQPGSHTPRSIAAAVLLGLAGCSTDDPPPADDTGDATAAGDTETIPDPAFLNPAIGEFTVESSEHVPRDLVVRTVLPGNTQLLLDGQTVGTLAPGSTFGELTTDRLRIFLRGALALGAHTLQLVSTGPGGPKFSAKLTMRVEPPQRLLPGLRAELTGTLGPGDALLEAGAGEAALLAVVFNAPTPILRLHPLDPLDPPAGSSWSTTPLAEVPLAGHVPGAMAFAPAVSAQRLPGDAGLRIAWRRSLPGPAIVTRDLALAPAPALGPEETALDPAAPLFDDAEYVALGRPFLVGDALVAEFTAADDAEIPHPGDRGLAHVRRSRAGAGWAAAQRVPPPGPVDLDATGRALVLTDLAAGALSVRVGQRLPGLLTFSDAGAALVSLAPDELELGPGDPCVLTTLATSLGGRTVATVSPDRLGLTFLATTGTPASKADVPPADKLPEAPITAPAAAGVVLGYSTFLIPYGDAAPVHALLGDGLRANVVPLTDPAPLFCDAVALLASLGGNDDAAPALPFACLGGGEVRLGVLTAAAP